MENQAAKKKKKLYTKGNNNKNKVLFLPIYPIAASPRFKRTLPSVVAVRNPDEKSKVDYSFS